MSKHQLQQTAALVRLHRNIGAARRIRRLPRPILPNMITLEYRREIMKLIAQVSEALKPLMQELPMLVASSIAERRLDIDEGKTVSNAVEIARKQLDASITDSSAALTAEKFAQRTSQHSTSQLRKQSRAALGVDVFATEAGIVPLINGFVAENAKLITSVPKKLLSDVELTVVRGLQRGTSTRELTTQIAKRFKLARNRAKVIARDQIGSLTSQITKVRQTNLGVKKYRWLTVNDERVRDDHADRQGRIFLWAKPPVDGHPGEAIQCRCSAEPIFDDILEGAA